MWGGNGLLIKLLYNIFLYLNNINCHKVKSSIKCNIVNGTKIGQSLHPP